MTAAAVPRSKGRLMADLGFIGLGTMGVPMAANLLAAGHTLAVHSRRRESAEPLVANGALWCASPGDVASRSDVVFTMVTDTSSVESVTLGGEGIVVGARRGTVVIDHSTISPAGTRHIADVLRSRGLHMLDAPVSGGAVAARAGSLAMMVGGDEEVFNRCRPLLAHLASTIVYIGGQGTGQIAKACNQICIVVNQLGAAEALLLAERSGVDVARVQQALMGGFAASRILEVQGPKMSSRRFEGQIESRLHHKDIQIALEMARELGLRLPGSSAAASVLTSLQEAGGAKLDSAAVFTVLDQS
jgi:3-hydroxyisobutyrate dehydrogenase-like beta-hydroxyacid dehydrogenase